LWPADEQNLGTDLRHGGYMPEHGHDQDHDDHGHQGSELSDVELRVRALETVLTEKGYVDPAVLDRVVEAYETRIGPHIGAAAVARAWVDPVFRAALLADASAAIADSGIAAHPGDHLIAVENTPSRHNIVVCTLCSCYPWAVLGLPPVWYKSFAYRSRTVKEPRRVLAEFGVSLPETTQIRVWYSTAETRYLVLPMRPTNTEGWDAERLAALVTRDSMVGTALARPAAAAP
jgi:nitrile hydratase